MIKNLPARYPELGRIRLGEKGPKGEPRKGKTLRFSSNDDVVMKALAEQLGGEVKPWDDPKAEQLYHLTTESASVPVLLPPDPIDTTYERWGSGGIAKRCDGERCIRPEQSPDGGHMVESDCACLAEGLIPGDREDVKCGACQVTVRLRLVIPSVPGIGAWICTSHSIYAAMELPGQVELLRAMSGRGRLVPAIFAIESRTEKKAWEKYKRDYIVPVLRIVASLEQLASGAPILGELSTPTVAPGVDCPVCGYVAPHEEVRDHLVSAHGWLRIESGGVVPPRQIPAHGPTAPPVADDGEHDSPAGAGPRPAIPPAGDVGGGAAVGESAPPPTASRSARTTALMAASTARYPNKPDRLAWAGDVLGRPLTTFGGLAAAEERMLLAALDTTTEEVGA